MVTRGSQGTKGPAKGTVKESFGQRDLAVQRFLGVALSGGKSDKTSVVILEYYPEHERLFLNQIHEKLKTEKGVTSDFQLFQLIQNTYQNISGVGMNAPLSLPTCMTCTLPCPGYEGCDEPHIKWMWDNYRSLKNKNRKKKQFTPYTQRCAELHMDNKMDLIMPSDDALGSNMAPLASRAIFLNRWLGGGLIEVNTRVSLLQLAKKLKISKASIKNYNRTIQGDHARRSILEKLEESKTLFLYKQDADRMTHGLYLFEALISALTVFLDAKGLCIPRPKGFPEYEQWPAIPED